MPLSLAENQSAEDATAVDSSLSSASVVPAARLSYRAEIRIAAAERMASDASFRAEVETVTKLNAMSSEEIESGCKMSELRKGQYVEAWHGGGWHGARITKKKAQKVDIQFADADYQTPNYRPGLIRLVAINDDDGRHLDHKHSSSTTISDRVILTSSASTTTNNDSCKSGSSSPRSSGSSSSTTSHTTITNRSRGRKRKRQ